MTWHYFSVLKLQKYSSQCSSCAFFKKIEQKLFWAIDAINGASATTSTINRSYTLYVNANAKALCSILYSSGNTERKSSCGPVDSPPVTENKTTVHRGLKLTLN